MSGLTIENILDDVEVKMMNTIEALEKNFSGIRTGKASPALVEGIIIDYYGTSTRLKDIAGITAPEPRMLVIQPWDQTAIKDIEKGILASDIGISPVNDGRIIRLPIPELSEERRRDMVKIIKKYSEDGRVEIRGHRRDANDFMKKALKKSEITEDVSKGTLKDIQELTDKYVCLVGEAEEVKEKELLKI